MRSIKAVLSTIGKFHTFDMARELHKRQHLKAIFTGYPMFKLRNEDIPESLIHSFPWVHAPYMGLPIHSIIGSRLVREWEFLDRISFARYVARNIPECDVFSGLSSSSLEAGRVIKQRGAKYICDRGSAHIRVQDTILREEHDRWDLPYLGIDQRTIDREEQEYAIADAITIPSTFTLESFINQGIDSAKLRRIPYGVNLSRFEKTSSPDLKTFEVLFVGAISLQKGIPYLLEAFKRVNHPEKRLTLIGSYDPQYISALRKSKLLTDDVLLKGHMPQYQLKNIMSTSHVMVLPSVQEGFGMVLSQALACGCPVIASVNTGAADLFTDGDAGYIVPIRDIDALAKNMQKLADDPVRRAAMSEAALRQVSGIGGWSKYGEAMTNLMRDLCK